MAPTTAESTKREQLTPVDPAKASLLIKPGSPCVDIPPYLPKQVQQPSPLRSISDPLPPQSPLRQLSSILGRHTEESVKSAGNTPKSPKNVRFGGDSMFLTKSTTSPAPKRKDMPKRRHSHEPRVNVYTECGRHSVSPISLINGASVIAYSGYTGLC